MSQTSRLRSWERLRRADWLNSPAVQGAVKAQKCEIQDLDEGVGPCTYDEYSLVIEAFPPGMTATSFMVMFGNRLNESVAGWQFWMMNSFARRAESARLRVGDIYDIDILGPFNGSVMFVATTVGAAGTGEHWFVFQTVATAYAPRHPECGAREFGLEPLARGETLFYTRGCSRPANFLMRHTASGPQRTSWLGLMQGMARAINETGGVARPSSISTFLVRGP